MLEVGTERIVAVEVEDRKATILRSIDGKIVKEYDSFTPWILAAERRDVGANWKELPGEGHKYLAKFKDWNHYHEGRNAFRKAGISIVSYMDPIKQYLMTHDKSLFGGMTFQEVNRMQLDIETTTLDPEAKDARILMIAISDSKGNKEVITGDEDEILINAITLINFWNPDVIEGHNLLLFDLPYMDVRAKKLNVKLTIGRDDSELRIGSENKCPIGPIKVAYRRCYVWGRHCIDTLIGVRKFDISKGGLESYGLKEAAAHYKLSSKDRVYIDRGKVSKEFNENPDKVVSYALHDVEETERLAALVFPTDFYQTQLLPDSYQNVCVLGSGEKVNLLMVREYMKRGIAVPLPLPTREYQGAFTEIRKSGILHKVVKADVESLYPSIMLQCGVKPTTDTEDVFLPMLDTLTKKRLEAKAKIKEIEKKIGKLKNVQV